MDCKGKRARKAEGFLQQRGANFVGPRQIRIIQHFVARVLWSLKRSVLRKIMQGRVHFTVGHESALAQQRLHRKVERKVENLVLGARTNFTEKSKIILQVFDDIQNQKEIEVHGSFFAKIGELEVQLIIFPRLAKLDCLRRDIVSPKFVVRAHLQLELPQNFACAAARFADCSRRKVISA